MKHRKEKEKLSAKDKVELVVAVTTLAKLVYDIAKEFF